MTYTADKTKIVKVQLRDAVVALINTLRTSPVALGATKINTQASTAQLTAVSSTTKKVLVQPRFNTADGSALNTGVCEIGVLDSEDAFVCYATISPTIAGVEIPCEDPSTLYLKTYVNGDGVKWGASNA